MKNDYSDEHQRKVKTDYEFLKDRIRNYFTPIATYFDTKKILNNGEIPEEEREGIIKILKECEEQCQIEVEKILRLIEGDD